MITYIVAWYLIGLITLTLLVWGVDGFREVDFETILRIIVVSVMGPIWILLILGATCMAIYSTYIRKGFDI
jgi:hypothetical protein